MSGVDLILSSLGRNTPAFSSLCNKIFMSTAIRVIFLLYDQPSKDLVTTLFTTPTSCHHEWLTINVDSKFSRLKTEYSITISDQNLIIAVFKDWEPWKIEYYKEMINSTEYGNFMFVSNDENLETSIIYKRLETLHQSGLHYFKAVLIHLNASTVNCYTLKNPFNNKKQLILIELSNNRSIFDQLFWNHYKQLDKGKLRIHARMRFPYLLVGKRRSKESSDQYEYGVSGSFIYMTGLMADYLNATLDLYILQNGIYDCDRKTACNFTSVTDAYFVDDRDPLLPALMLEK